VLTSFSLKWLSEAKLKAQSKNLRQVLKNFDAKLSFTLLASLRSAIFIKIQAGL